MKSSILAAAVVGVLSICLSASAATLVRQVTQIVDEQLVDESGIGTFYVNDYAHFAGDSPNLTQDFSVDKTLTFRFEAPAGSYFLVTPPGPGFDLYLRIQLNNPVVGPYISGVTLDGFNYIDTQGTVPAGLGYYSQVSTHPFFYVEAGTPVTDPFRFSAFEVSFSFPAGFTADLVNYGIIYTVRGQRKIEVENESDAPPPAVNWIQIVTVPEPSSAALITLPALAAAIYRRR
ncbi:MAG: hypothetical protein GC162_01115 [Planctomycetes bacterium]|nr:hypothetical protein [Planctomycetota bacterium]